MYYSPLNEILVITRRKLNGLGDHWGVQLSDGRVAHYTAEHDFQVISIGEFAQERDVQIVRVVPRHLNSEVQARLWNIAQKPRPYHATDWNCEIFANWLTGESATSSQVSGWAVAAVATGLLWLGAQA